MDVKRLKTNESADLSVITMAANGRKHYEVISAIIKPTDLFLPRYRTIYSQCVECYESTDADDAIAHVITACGNNAELRSTAIDLIAGFITGSNAEHYALMVKQAAMMRDVFKLSFDLDAKFDIDDDPFEALFYIENRLQDITPESSKVTAIADVLSEHYQRSAETYEQKKARLIPLGIDTLDDLLDGGCESGDLLIIGARPSQGKTALGITIFLRGIRNGHTVGFLSLEMACFQIIRRVVSQISEIPMTALKGATLNDSEYSRLAMAHSELSSLDGERRMFIYDGEATLSQVKHTLQQFSRDGCKIVIIDYLQLVKIDGLGKSKTREQEVAEVSRSLKSYAKQFGIVLIALAQLNRSLETRADKTPIISDLRESGAIEQDADCIALLDRPEQRGQTTATFQGDEVSCVGKAFIHVVKQRNGRTGAVTLGYEGAIGKFTDIEINNEWV
jgi:replicative DNA helicase